jgi:RNA polymerase sigma-70 factor, ECF subfamily
MMTIAITATRMPVFTGTAPAFLMQFAHRAVAFLSGFFSMDASNTGTAEPLKCGSAENTDDTLYVKQCQQGDSRAFEELVYRYQDMIFSLCVRMLGNRTDGEDAAQETFVKAFEAIKNFRFEALFSTWLYRIATNICRNRSMSFWNRFSKKAIRLDAETDNEEGGCLRQEIAASGPDPERELEGKWQRKYIHEAIMKLPVGQREVVVLADVQELSYEEIQAITNMAIGTIKSRLNRGREALKRLLEDL